MRTLSPAATADYGRDGEPLAAVQRTYGHEAHLFLTLCGSMMTLDATQVAVCPRCAARLTIVGVPAQPRGSAMFSVACGRCRGRVLLGVALRHVRLVTVAETSAPE